MKLLAKKINFVEKMLFTKHISTMLHAGIPLPEALTALMDSKNAQSLTEILKKLLAEIQNGATLASALQKYPESFSPFYISLVEVGEQSGTLEENMIFLAEHLQKEHNLKQKIQGAMFYPALVMFAALGMSSFIAFFILPQLLSFFDSFDIELPVTTQILLAVANFMKSYGIIFFVSVILGFFALLGFLNLKQIKPWYHRFILRVPLFGQLLLFTQLTRFSRNLGIMLRSGIPINEALRITANTLSNIRLQSILHELEHSLNKGVNVSDLLAEKNYYEFPSVSIRMIAVGEKTGNLESTLLYLASFYEDEIDSTTKSLTNILEPMLLLVIGTLVGFVALAIITPIYELTGSIRRG